MPVISVYNNKGGVGKSTLTVGLAEFLAANRKRRVLVVDLDAQASSSGALLGRSAVSKAIESKRTISHLAARAIKSRRLTALSDFVTVRAGSTGRGMALADIDVLVPDKEAMIDLEDRTLQAGCVPTLRDNLRPALGA